MYNFRHVIKNKLNRLKKDISKTFINKYEEIFDSKRGGGYWLWKYYVINKTLGEISELLKNRFGEFQE